MALYNSAVITNSGLSLLAAAQIEAGAVTFTKVMIGAGTHAGDLHTVTALTDPRNTFGISSVSQETDGKLKVKFIITNSEVLVGYDINEIGVYGKIGDGTETLIAISTAINPDYLPDKDTAPATIIVELYLEITNCENVTFSYTVPSGVYALAEDAALKTEIPTELPANGGNADTVNNFKFSISTEVPTTLQDNEIRFIYSTEE